MRKNGFTLVELIGTVVILSLMMLIIIPVVSKSMKKGIKDADAEAKENIELAAESYITDSGLGEFSSSNTNVKKIDDSNYCITVSYLQSKGYLDDNLKLPSNQSTMNGRVKIVKNTTSSKKIKYTYSYEVNTSC